eukprot:CAMPEP_0172613460 /NCGR_PEP_ID=MMETSP1068-20121228/43321_1 /TAXON_ID=35684 /ORGANISM="Pseudopedinella elastica, Strain CCMP716" /LENGTH=235 /DNA_ID=CAMNT_0013417915 /DNA_START=241 /DNA_END=948 /DNA_ORIENTATION=+
MQMPPKGSKAMQPDDPRNFVTDSNTFRHYDNYVPNEFAKGTMKPGTTPENSPLDDILNMEIPHTAPYYQEVPYHIRWPESHPASTPILLWLEEIGKILTDEEEEEIDARGRSSAKARAAMERGSKGPRMLSPEDIEEELKSGSDGAVQFLETVEEEQPTMSSTKKKDEADEFDELDLDTPWTAATANAKTKKKPKAAAKQAQVEATFDFGGDMDDEELLEQALGGFDLSDDDDLD